MAWSTVKNLKTFNMLRLLITGILLSSYNIIFSQDTISLSLEQSIEVALKNNPDLRSSELEAKRSKILLQQANTALFPDIGANYNFGKSTGRSIDPFTNAYINRELTFSNASLNLDLPVFNGFRLLNTIRQNRLQLKAAQLEVEEAQRNLILNVTLSYLRVLNARDLVELARNRMETTSQQVERLRTLYEQGVGNPADYTDIRGQVALNRNELVQAKTSLKDALLELNRLLNSEEEITAEDVDLAVPIEKYPFSVREILEEAFKELPGFKAREIRVEASKKGVNAARSLYFPTVSLFGSLSTNYSSAAEVFNQVGTERVETGDFVSLDGEELPVLTDQLRFEGEFIDYKDQFENNLGSIFGVAVNIPLFQGFRAKHAVALEKIGLEESKIALQNARLQLEEAIKLSYYEMEAALNRYNNLLEQVQAFEESFIINEIRFNNGVSTIVEYTISKNNLDNAKINLNNARYEYLLRSQILDYYRGGKSGAKSL